MNSVLSTGAVLDGYRIDGILGKGGMSIVYEAMDLSLDRPVALKVIASDIDEDPEFRERFRREGVQQAKLSHPHIVPVYRAAEVDGQLFIAMQLIRGRSLKELALGGGLKPERSLHILGQIASALDFAHVHGAVHRDVKPQNVLIDEFDNAYLADFGLVKSRGDRSLTRAGRNFGSIDYMSPEQIMEGETPISGRSDTYALAAVLYECLSGSVPFPRETDGAILFAHVQEPPLPISQVNPELPGALDGVLARGMAKRPDERPQTATELIELATMALATGTPPAGERAPRGQTVVDLPTFRAQPPAAAAATSERRVGIGAHVASLPRRALAVGGAVVVLAIVLGFVAGGSRGSGASRSLSAGPLAVSYPSSWTATRPVALPGLRSAGAVGLEQKSDGEHLTADLLVPTDVDQLPQALARSVRGLAPPQAVTVGSLSAYRYRTRGGGRLYALPTSVGTALLYCTGPEATHDGCESIVAATTLNGAVALPLGPDATLARRLATTVRTLDTARSTARTSLAHAATPAAQAAAAARLARAYQQAGRALHAAAATVSARVTTARLGRALTAAWVAARQLATAARKGDRSGFAHAARAEAAADGGVQAALLALVPLGYRLAG